MKAIKSDPKHQGVGAVRDLDDTELEHLPDLAFMAGYTNKNGLFPEWEIGMRLRVPLYFWRRQRAGVTEATYAKVAAEENQRNVRMSLGVGSIWTN